jgi:hypothetical protein
MARPRLENGDSDATSSAVSNNRGLATLNGDHTIQGLNDLRDAISLTVGLTLGLIVGAAPMQAASFRPRRRR